MNLTPRCKAESINHNHTQCPNDSVPPSPFCKLHIAHEEGAKLSPTHPKYVPPEKEKI